MDKAVRDMLRLTTIKRWTIIEMVRDQSVAEHAYGVWVLANDLYRVMEDVPHNSFEREEVSFWALTHDMEEVYTGDLPSTVKEVVESIAPGALKTLKEKILMDHFPRLAARMRGVDRTLASTYVKIAEIVESILYVRSYAIDRNRAMEVENTLTAAMDSTLAEAERKYNSIPWDRAFNWVVDMLAREPLTPTRGLFAAKLPLPTR